MDEFIVKASAWEQINAIASYNVGKVTNAVYNDALMNVPRDSNNLADSIKPHHISGDLEGRVSVGTEYWAAQEYGARPHTIRVRTKKVLSDGTSIFGKEVHHPGNRPQPFMRPSLYKRRIIRKGI